MLQFYIKLFGKDVGAADSLKQFVCSDTKAVVTSLFITCCGMFLMLFKRAIFIRQSQEEAGSAGEQPASSKTDGDDYCSVNNFVHAVLWIKIIVLTAKKTHSPPFI